MKKLFKKITALSAMLSLLLVQASVAQAAFGISPPLVKVDHLKPGSKYVTIVNLSTNETSKRYEVDTKYSGNESLGKWLSIEGRTIEKGDNTGTMKIRINVPEDAKAGNYTGNVALTVNPPKEVNGIGINLGGNIKVDITVTNQDISDYRVRALNISRAIEGQPLVLDLNVDNLGNTQLTQLPVTVEIWDRSERNKVASVEASELRRAIAPFTSAKASIEVPIENLDANKYWLRAKVAKNGQSIFETKSYLAVEEFVLPSGSARTSVTVPGLGASITSSSSGGAGVATSLRVKGPYEDALIMTTAAIVLVLTIGFAYKSYYRKN